MKRSLTLLWPIPVLIFLAILQLYIPDLINLDDLLSPKENFDREVVVHATLAPTENGYFPNGFDYNIHTLSVEQNVIQRALDAGGDKLCIDYIFIDALHSIVFLGQGGVNYTADFANQQHCLVLKAPMESDLYGIGLNAGDKAIPLFSFENTNYAFFFPFDIHYIKWKATVGISLYKNDDILYSFIPKPFYSITSSRSDQWLFVHANGMDPVTRILRPPLLIVLIPVIVIFIVFISLVIPSIESLSTATEVGISLLVTLFTINQIVIPDSHGLPLLLDYFLIGEVFVILLTLLTVYNSGKTINRKNADKTQVVPTNYLGFPRSNVYHMHACMYLSQADNEELINLSDVDIKRRRPCKKCISTS